jgi:hypothetical protein
MTQACAQLRLEIRVGIRAAVIHRGTFLLDCKKRYWIDPEKRQMHPMIVHKENLKGLAFMCLAACLLAVLVQASPARSEDEEAYGERFFDQLRTIFGRFRDLDLQKAFQEARPIACSELLGRKGEWRPVAFFNEDRKLGDWCRENLQEVKNDLEVYTFSGSCTGNSDAIKVTTEFPTTESIEDYQRGNIDFGKVDVMVNDPVRVLLDKPTMAYTFDLPYLFLTEQRGSRRTYSFNAPNRNSAYATEVSARWECKLVSSNDVTYRFLICRTATVPRGSASRNRKYEPSFGSSAFYILSDGMEAQTSVKVLAGTADPGSEPPPQEPSSPDSPTRPTLTRKGKTTPNVE